MSDVVRRNDTKSTNEADYHLVLPVYLSAVNEQGATRAPHLPTPHSIAAPFPQSPKHAQQPQHGSPSPAPIWLAQCSSPACDPSR